jgi:thiamine biosynthesis protein ThiC
MTDELGRTIEDRLRQLEEASKRQQDGIDTLLSILESGKALFKIGNWIMAALKAVVPVAVGIVTIYQWFRGSGK